MTPAQRVVLATLDAVNAGDGQRVQDLVAADFLDHAAVLGAPACDTGIRYEVHDVFGAGDRVAVRATARGTREGRQFAVPTMHICRVADGRLAEHWAVRDDLTLLRQIGAVADARKEP